MEFSKKIESVEMTEILSLGKTLELVKDIGDAGVVSKQYELDKIKGTHAIGHSRMATESGVDIRSAHPYWAYPFSDVSVVHNGQLTNYWNNRRALENKGMRFMSECDSELIAVYLGSKNEIRSLFTRWYARFPKRIRWSFYLFSSDKRFVRYGKRYNGSKTYGIV